MLDALSPASPPILGGHSAGAYFALNWVLQNPTCGGLVLLEGGYLDPVPDGTDLHDLARQNQDYLASRRFLSWETFFEAERDAARHWDHDAEVMLQSQMIEYGGAVVPRIRVDTANQVMSALAPYRVQDITLVSCPALLVMATLPTEMAPQRREGAAKLRDKIPGLEVVEVPDAGHDLLLDNPTAVSQCVWEFLSRINSPTT